MSTQSASPEAHTPMATAIPSSTFDSLYALMEQHCWMIAGTLLAFVLPILAYFALQYFLEEEEEDEEPARPVTRSMAREVVKETPASPTKTPPSPRSPSPVKRTVVARSVPAKPAVPHRDVEETPSSPRAGARSRSVSKTKSAAKPKRAAAAKSRSSSLKKKMEEEEFAPRRSSRLRDLAASTTAE